MTPEGRVKKTIRVYLSTLKPDCWWFMPVPMMYQEKTVDFIGCYKGRGWAIEAKAPGETPTEFQYLTLQKMQDAGMITFVIDGNLRDLRTWIGQIDADS